MTPFANTPPPPYYAVIFVSERTADDDEGYGIMAGRMAALAAEQPGYLGIESVRGDNGIGITVAYWKDLESIANWRQHAEHRLAQEQGKAKWYQRYQVRICKVDAAYSFEKPAT